MKIYKKLISFIKKALKGVCIISFLMVLITSCRTTRVNDNTNNNSTSSKKFYETYSKKLGVQLEGYEDKKFIETVSSWIGVPYKYAGSTKSGTDCSGFVHAIYKEVYTITLTRSSSEMINEVKKADVSRLQMGDIVFFKINSKKVSHVGLYLKDNKFIHASTAKEVIVSSLDEAYYKKYFYTGGKVLKLKR